MLALIHYAHILLAMLWLGGTLTLALAVFPVLARLGSVEAGRLFDAIAAVAGPLLGASGGLTMLIGPLRAYLGGGVTSLADLGSPYGIMVVAAFVLLGSAEALGGLFRRKFKAALVDPARFAATAPAMVARQSLVTTLLALALVAIMVALGLGLY